jgi:putative PEP-CTERM system TPR-repeat lipoprotein
MKHLKPLLWTALALAAAACSPNDPAALVGSAKEYLTKRDYSAAIIQLKNALQKDPENAQARYLLGLASLESGDLVSADIELNKAVQLGLNVDEVQVALARTLLARGGPDQVLEKFGSVKLGAAKPQAEMRAVVGLAHLARGQRSEAAAAFNEALAADPANLMASLGTARLSAIEGKRDKALAQTETVLAAAPSSVEAHLFKADLLAAQGKGESAERSYRDAIGLAPKHMAARLSLVAHLVRQKSLEKATEEVGALERMAPNDPRTSYVKATVLVEQRKFPAAKEALQQVLKVAPEHVPSLMLAGMSAFESGAYPEAEGHLRKAVSKAPEAIAPKRMLAATRLRLGQTELAMKDVRELLARAGEDASVVSLAGETYLASGDLAMAARYFEKAKSLQPSNALHSTRLAQVRFAAGDMQRGIKELQAASASDPGSHHADLALVATYLRQRQADKALEALKSLEKKQPDNPVTHDLRGLALLLKQDIAAARASFERALQLHPTHMPAVANLARLDLREKKPAAARKRYEAVLEKEPNNEAALQGLAVLMRVTGADAKEIERLLKQAVAGNPRSASARTNLVRFYARNRDVKSALTAAQEAHAALPNDPSITEALGVTQLGAREPRQAIATFMRLTEMRPKASQPHVHLARAYLAAKQPDDAIKALRAAVAVQPDLSSAYRGIAAIYVATGRTDEAVREARDLQTQHPKQPLGYALEGEVYVAKKDWGRAESAYLATLKKFDLPGLVIRAHAIMENGGRRKQADDMADQWIKRHPKDIVVLTHLGNRDTALKRYSSAASRYRNALERQPDNVVLLNNLAWASHQLKQPGALEYAERAHELAPGNAAIMDTLGWILTERGERERGLELLGRATELAPNAHNYRLHFAKALIKAGQKEAARKELQTLAKLDNRLAVQKEAASLLASL